jgi:hypothetical protein
MNLDCVGQTWAMMAAKKAPQRKAYPFHKGVDFWGFDEGR